MLQFLTAILLLLTLSGCCQDNTDSFKHYNCYQAGGVVRLLVYSTTPATGAEDETSCLNCYSCFHHALPYVPVDERTLASRVVAHNHHTACTGKQITFASRTSYMMLRISRAGVEAAAQHVNTTVTSCTRQAVPNTLGAACCLVLSNAHLIFFLGFLTSLCKPRSSAMCFRPNDPGPAPAYSEVSLAKTPSEAPASASEGGCTPFMTADSTLLCRCCCG